MNEKEKTYSIVLSDGTKLINLGLNGNNFISDVEITEDVFDGKLQEVTISDGEEVQTYHNMELIQIQKYNGEWRFILREIPEEELKARRLRADIEYIAMMTGIELEA